MDVFLTSDLETWIRESLSTGSYTSEGQLVRRALRLLREHEAQLSEQENEPVMPFRRPTETPRIPVATAK